MNITVNTYFSGAGLFDIGLLQGGLEIAQSFELDQKACEVQRANLPHEVVQADISQKLVFDDQPCDVMVFTYPCTKYSSIADIHGTRTGDDLFLHAFRHIALRKPEVYVIENVPGMKKFQVVMEAMTRLPDYYVQVFCPIQSSTWLPQKRDRLIVMASRQPFNWLPPETNRRVSLADVMEKDVVMDIPLSVYSRLDGKYRDKPIISDPAKGDIAPTCVAHYSKDLSTRLVVDKTFPRGVRPYTVREYARLQGVPDWFRFDVPNTAAYRMIGNGVSVPVGEWVAKEIKRYWQRNSVVRHAKVELPTSQLALIH